MLRITASTSSGQAKSYFSTADYYTEGQELVGQWRGKGATLLGLSGEIAQPQWDALCDNLHPQTGEQLTPRTREFRRVGYDFTFNVPKSVSVLHALTEDDRLLEAVRESVRETMNGIEAEMQTRIRKGGRDEDRTTSNIVMGEFVHLTSRPVDGIPDPQLHAHCFIFNATFDEQEQAWKAGQFGALKRDATYYEAKFHVRLGEKLADLGIEIERKQKFWDIAGISPSIIDKFSRRTKEIEAEAKRKGITDPALKAELGAKTRSKKQKNIPIGELRDEWRSWLTADERDSLARVASRLGGEPINREQSVARTAIELAEDHCFERQSVVPERKLLARALLHSVGKASIADVEEAYRQKPFLVRERGGQRMVTTPEVLAEEQHMLDFARRGRGSRRAFKPGPHEFTRAELNAGQRNAVEHILQSKDSCVLVRGVAGTGKTTLLREAVEAIEQSGSKVFAFAPSARASRGVLRSKGFADAETVARLLIDENLQKAIQGQVILIDEAGMVGVRTMARVFSLAKKIDAKIILAGDRFQHGPVERGEALRLLEQQAGLVSAEVKEIFRQSDCYRKAVMNLSDGEISNGFRKLDELGWIREVPDPGRYRILANDYIDAINRNETALVISPTHLEAERCTDAIRLGLKDNGRIEVAERRFDILLNSNLTEGERGDAVNYSAGDVLCFHQNAKGFKRGQRVELGEVPPPVDQAARFQLFHPGYLDIAEGDVLRITQNGKTLDGCGRLDNGDLLHVTGFDKAGNILTKEKKTIAKDYGHLAYGYVTTSYGSQGTDVQRVIIGQSADSLPASSAAQFYVSISRGERSATVYTDSKANLLEAVASFDERLSATELISGAMIAERSPAMRERDPFDRVRAGPELERKKEELIYER